MKPCKSCKGTGKKLVKKKVFVGELGKDTRTVLGTCDKCFGKGRK